MNKSPDAFRTISEVARDLSLPQHVLRFWETRFSQIKPLKRGGGRRYYRPDDVELLESIRRLLYGEGYTIRGVQRLLKEQGVRAVAGLGRTQSGAAAAHNGSDAGRAGMAQTAEPEAPSTTAAAGAPPAIAAPGGQPPEAAAARSRQRNALARLDFQQLQTVLVELAECARVLAAARLC